MDKFKAIQTFLSIADEGSLTAAARRLGSSLPAVVRSLAALEKALGVRLFNRSTRRVALTDEGRRYLESCRQVLSTLDESERELSAEASVASGNLNVTAPVLFGQMYVAPAVTRFVQRYPGMRVNLMLLDRVVNLLDEGMDVGLRISPLADSSQIARCLGSVRRVVAASPAYLERHGEPRQPRELTHANCIRFSGTALDWSFQDGRKRYTVAVSGNLSFNHMAAVADACVAGLGFGMFMSYQVAPQIARGQLRIVLEAFETPPRPINVVYPQARLLPARAKVFIEWIAQELNGLLPR